MKHLLLTGLTILTIFAHAETEFAFGAASYHFLGATNEDAAHFRNKWSKDGRLIGTPLVAIERVYHDDVDGYTSMKYLIGQNSMGGAMAGVATSKGCQSGLFRYGGLLGAYAQDATPFYRSQLSPGGVPVGNSINIQVLFGGEIVYGSAVKWHLVVTPALGLTYLSFAF